MRHVSVAILIDEDVVPTIAKELQIPESAVLGIIRNSSLITVSRKDLLERIRGCASYRLRREKLQSVADRRAAQKAEKESLAAAREESRRAKRQMEEERLRARRDRERAAEEARAREEESRKRDREIAAGARKLAHTFREYAI